MSSPAHTPRADAVPAFYDPDDYRPEQSIAFLMRRIINALSAEVERRFEPSGLTNAQWVPLIMLHMGRASMVAELARECQLDAGGMTRLLDRLETKGLVRRVRSSADRRVVNLELTEEGREAAARIPAVLCDVQNTALRGFSGDEWQLLRQMLTRILANARALQAEPEAQP
jgi:DNA-binding MarR family transcriptional regulator